MRNIIVAVVGLAAFGASAALADSNVNCGAVAASEWMSAEQAQAKVAEQGFEVRSSKREDSCWEVYAIDPDGKLVEVFVHPASGELVKVEDKS